MNNTAITSGRLTVRKTYLFQNKADGGRSLNVWCNSTYPAENLSNVCLWKTDKNDNAQRWTLSYSKNGDNYVLKSEENSAKCLDLYTGTGSGANINAHLYSESSTSYLIFENGAYSNTVRIRLAGTTKNGYYLTANQGNPGSNDGRGVNSKGNVYFYSELLDDESQEWEIIDPDSSSGGETGGSGDTYTINGKTIPLSDCPINTYWTTDGKPSDIDGTTSKYFNGKQCAGFARYVYAQIWGSDTKGTQLDTEKATLFPINGNSSDLSSFPIGSRLVCTVRQSFDPNSDKFDKTRTDSHQMIILKKTSSAVTVYHANWDEHCKIEIDEWNYTEFYNRFKKIKGASFIPPSAS